MERSIHGTRCSLLELFELLRNNLTIQVDKIILDEKFQNQDTYENMLYSEKDSMNKEV